MRYAELFAGAPARFTQRVDASGDCWLWTGRTQAGRGYGLIWWNGSVKGAHRVAYELAVGPIPPGAVVMHRCDTPACVNPTHLAVGTHADNQHDKVRKGRQARGERQGHARLTDAQVVAIRERAAAGERQADLAREFGVRACTVNDIVRRRWWRHL